MTLCSWFSFDFPHIIHTLCCQICAKIEMSNIIVIKYSGVGNILLLNIVI